MGALRSFPKNFLWGASASSYQVEGAAWEDGRGASIWDTFSRIPGKVAHGHTGDVSVDQYHRYPEDVKLIRDMGLGAYHFSIAWPRIQPDGRGAFNDRGFDYYRRLSDELHGSGVRSVATLYHWDLPQPLEDGGGWPERDTAYRFADYAAETFRRLQDCIDIWITLNEPWCSAVLGYHVGVHAPGKTSRTDSWAAGHHLMLGHGLSLAAYRSEARSENPAPIGITLNLDSPHAATGRAGDRAAADRAADMRTRFFLDPLLGRGYPERHFSAYPGERRPPVKEGDMELIAEPVDFLGLNFYYEPTVAASDSASADQAEGFREVGTHYEKTDMGWPVTPRGLYRHLKWVWNHTEGRFPLYITENGCAMPDVLSPDRMRCHDPRRVAFLRDHLTALLDAVDEGVDVRGYYVWSLIDNFEWSFGYTKRFGVIYADYINQRRIPKDSYYYLRSVISGAENL